MDNEDDDKVMLMEIFMVGLNRAGDLIFVVIIIKSIYNVVPIKFFKLLYFVMQLLISLIYLIVYHFTTFFGLFGPYLLCLCSHFCLLQIILYKAAIKSLESVSITSKVALDCHSSLNDDEKAF